MPAQHAVPPMESTLPGRVEGGEGAPSVGRSSAAGRRRSANGSYLSRERSVDLEDADAILATDWGRLTPRYPVPRAAQRRVEFQEQAGEADCEQDLVPLNMVNRAAGDAARRETEPREDVRPDKEYMPGLPPRYRLRDLIQGDFAFDDDGER